MRVREGRPYVFTDLRRNGLDEIIAFIEKMGGLARRRRPDGLGDLPSGSRLPFDGGRQALNC